MKMRKKRLAAIFMAAVMAVSVSACGSSASDNKTSSGSDESKSTADAGLTKVTLGTSPWPTNMFFYLAKEEGIFEKNGLDVDIQEFSSTTDSSNAFVGGQTDFCTYASSETISPFAEGADIKIVLETDKSNGCEGIVAKSDIKSVKDLKGKTIATQVYSVDHMLLLTLLDENGMSEDDVNIVDMSIQESGNAFIAGQCDAASIWDPYFSQAVNAGGVSLYSTKDNPDLITDVLAASGELCKNDPDTVKAMVKSFFDAKAYWEQNTEEASAFMAEKLGVETDEFNKEVEGLQLPSEEDVVTAFTEADDYSYWGYTQNKVLSFMKNLGVLDKEVDCGDMIDASFVKELAGEKSN